jgi:hypothetical protein
VKCVGERWKLGNSERAKKEMEEILTDKVQNNWIKI